MQLDALSDKKNKVLLILGGDGENTLDFKEILSALDSVDKCSWKIILLNYAFKKKLSDENIKSNFIDDYFLEEDHYIDYDQAIKISNSWHLDSAGNDATYYHGISIGTVLQRWVIVFYNNLLSNIRTVRRVLDEETPDEVWFYGSQSERAWKNLEDPNCFTALLALLAKKRNIACKIKTLPKKTKSIEPASVSQSFFQKYKSRSYSLVVSKILLFIKYNLMMRKNKNLVNILLPSPQSLNYIGIAAIGRILQDRQKNVYVWRGETAKQRKNLIDISPRPFFRPKQNSEQVIAKVKEQFSNFVDSTEIEELKDVQDLLEKVYMKQIEPRIKDVIVDIEQLEPWFERMNFHLVFSHSDTTIKERTVVSVANRYNVPSVVLQHGAAGHYWGFLPLVASKFAAWGEITERWFEKNGVSKERICITGAANFDSYVKKTRSEQGNESVKWEGFSNYLLYVTVRGKLMPTGFKITEQDNVRLLDAILDVVGAMPEKMLVIKVKPGDPQTQFYKSEIKRRELKNACVIERTDNGKLLNACGVLLTTYSTMALEALFFSKPIIQLKFVNKKKLMKRLYEENILCDEEIIPLQKYGVALGVDSPEELKKAILKVYEDKSIRKSLVESGEAFLERYGYARDGNASLRMISCIEEMLGRIPSHN